MGFVRLKSGSLRLGAAVFVALTLATAFGDRGAPPAAAAGDCTIDATMDVEEQAFLALINNYRVQNGLGPLTASYMVTKAAAWKSKDLATNNYFAHDDLTRTWVQRIRDCDYGFNTYLGENIAAGYTTGASVFAGWQSSAGHNANMLGANYTTIGIGRHYVSGSTYGWYWTTDFGGFSDGWATISGGVSPIDSAPTPDAGAPPIAQAVQPPPLAYAAAADVVTPERRHRHRDTVRAWRLLAEWFRARSRD